MKCSKHTEVYRFDNCEDCRLAFISTEPIQAGFVKQLKSERDTLKRELKKAKSQCVVCSTPFGAHGSEPDEPSACIGCSEAPAKLAEALVRIEILTEDLGCARFFKKIYEDEIDRLQQRLVAWKKIAKNLFKRYRGTLTSLKETKRHLDQTHPIIDNLDVGRKLALDCIQAALDKIVTDKQTEEHEKTPSSKD